MNRTFYIPKDKEQVMHDFVDKCQKQKINYSKLLVEFMENYIKQKKAEQDGNV